MFMALQNNWILIKIFNHYKKIFGKGQRSIWTKSIDKYYYNILINLLIFGKKKKNKKDILF